MDFIYSAFQQQQQQSVVGGADIMQFHKQLYLS